MDDFDEGTLADLANAVDSASAQAARDAATHEDASLEEILPEWDQLTPNEQAAITASTLRS